MNVDEIFDIKGQAALSAGASAGLGSMFAETLASGEARLAICARGENELKKLAQFLKKRYKAGVFFTSVDAPGAFPSEGTKSLFKDGELVKRVESLVLMPRMGRHDDLKGVVLFLAPHASDYVTGHTIPAGGGWTIW